MTERFHNIEDETFPSFLTESYLSDSSRILDNITISSNLGLPVAASTVAKARADFDRPPDVLASYLEEGRISRSGSNPNSVSECDPKGKFALSFKDDMEDKFIGGPHIPDVPLNAYLKETNLTGNVPKDFDNGYSGHSPDTSFGILPLERMEDLSIGLCTLPLQEKEKKKVVNLPQYEESLSEEARLAICDHSNASFSSFLENEKLLSITGLDGSSTDEDVDDEELYDNHLQAYFEKLVPPEMQRGDIEGQELSEPNGVPTLTTNRYNQDNFQMLHVRMGATGMDSAPASDEDGENDEEEATHLKRENYLHSNVSRLLQVNEDYRTSFQPGLEGGSSDDYLEFRQSTAVRTIASSVMGNGVADGSSGSEDERRVAVVPSFSSNAQALESWGTALERNIAGEESEDPMPPLPQETEHGITPNDIRSGRSIDSLYLQCVDDEEMYELPDASQKNDPQSNQKSKPISKQTFYLKKACESGGSLPEENTEGTNPNQTSHFEPGLSDAYLSPTSDRVVDYQNTSEKRWEQNDNWSIVQCTSRRGVSPPHSVVYQNENGQWVTDLAYYTPFDKEQSFNITPAVAEPVSDEDFIPGSAAIGMIEEDQKEFEKEHRFIQEEVMDIEEASLGLGDSSWKMSASSTVLLRASQVAPDLRKEDASYLRLSLGEFFGQRSEALGFLGGDFDGKRPSFGYYIMSPEKQEPIALIRSGTSRGSSDHDETIKFDDDTLSPEDLEELVNEQPKFGFSTFNIGELEHAPEVDKRVSSTHVGSTQEEHATEKADTTYPRAIQESDSLLSISTIASAIANASSSSDPSQLAAMIMALSTKNRKHPCTPATNRESDAASKNPVFYSSLNNTDSISRFDIERYLKKTDASCHDTDVVSSVENETSVPDVTWDISLLCRQATKGPSDVELLTSTAKIKKVAPQSLLDVNERKFENNAPSMDNVTNLTNPFEEQEHGLQSLGDGAAAGNYACSLSESKTVASKVSAGKHSTGKSSASSMKRYRKDSNTKLERASRRQSNAKLPGSDAKHHQNEPTTNDRVSSSKHLRCTASLANSKSDLVTTNKDIETIHLVDITGHQALDCKMQTIPPETSPTAALGNLKSACKSSTCKSGNSLGTKNIQSLEEHMKIQEARKSNQEIVQVGTSKIKEKHVNFQHAVPTSQNIDVKSNFPQHDGNYSEDEQYSFRPSTSPLIHSSPSQDSETISLSGSGDSPTCTNSVTRIPSADNSSSQSSFSSPSMSRLTYISATDSTLQNTKVIPSPEKEMSNNTFQLSTTIVRASPTPSEECAIKHSSENISWQHKGEQTSLNTCPRKMSKKLEEPQSKYLTSKDEIIKGSSPKKQHELESACVSFTSKEKKNDSVNSSSPSKLGLVCNSKPVNVNDALAWKESSSKMQTLLLSPLNVLPASGVYTTSSENLSDNPYVPIPTFKSVGATSGYSMSSGVPTLLTGRSLSTTPFAQHFLGSVPSGVNIDLPQFPVGTSTFGLAARFPDPASQARHMQNCINVGAPFNSNVGPGLLSTLPLTAAHVSSLNQNSLNNAKSYTGQSCGTSGLQHWGTRMSSGYGHVLVPDELRFPNACCVGIASQTSLSMFNPTERWLQVSIAILSVSVNGEKMDTLASQCLVFRNKTIIGPHAAEDLKILFLPLHSGIFQCVLSVSSCPVSADADTILQSEALATRVILTAFAENPSIEIDTGKTDCLDFGDLASGTWKALPLKLINTTQATVPIRLIISANAAAWRCFAFSKEPVNLTEHARHADLISQLVSPSVMNHVMRASHDGQNAEVLVVWVIFNGPKKYIASESLGPADEFLARVDVELDSPGPSCVIKTIPLRARTGTARIHAPKDLQTVHLCAQVSSSAKQFLPLKNAGNISVDLKIKCSDQGNCFFVEPPDLFLMPGEEQEVAVSFVPQNAHSKEESMLKILVQPSGPQYEVMLKGWVENLQNRKSLAPDSSSSSDVPPILSNKQFMSWGGVTLGRAVQQKLILRNNSSSLTQNLRLLIRGQDQDCFQLKSTFGPEERLTNNRDVAIRPKEDITICLMFAPSRVGCMLAKLEIKQSGVRSSQPGIKFTIPLSGYGGTSNIILENVKKLSDSYMAVLNGMSAGNVSKVSFYLRNTGSRAAYVNAVCFMDIQGRTIMDPNVMSIFPEKLVVLERSQEKVTVTCHSTAREQTLCNTRTALIATICFFCGDEVSRKQYRRALFHKPEAPRQTLSENSLLKNVNFDEEFKNEKLVNEVYDLPQRPNDLQLFYGTMQKVILSVVGSATDTNTHACQPSPRGSLDSDSLIRNAERNIGNTSLDVLPVKGPQGPPLPLTVAEHTHHTVDSEPTWTIEPEHLILTAQSKSGTAGAGHITMLNYSTRELKFELSWPAHCLTITPQHGVIEPQSNILILVSPNPSFAAKSSVLPWSGQIYVHCDDGQKYVRVQIQKSIALDPPVAVAKQFPVRSLQCEAPIVHMAKPFSKQPSAHIEVKDRTLIFPRTASGSSSETYLDIENPSNGDVKWHLSSFAPPYVKGVDASGDVYRATYTAFRCARISGILEAGEREKVAITFFPRDRGDYAQFWDLECHPVAEAHMKHKLRFQLCGEGIKAENPLERASSESLIKTEVLVKPRRRSGSEASTLKVGEDEVVRRGVYAPEELYTFPPTRVGESSTLKVNLQNNGVTAHMLKFVSPREPFHMKHSKYTLRSHHYINLPIKFKPNSTGRFEGLLAVQTDTCGSLKIQLIGEALET